MLRFNQCSKYIAFSKSLNENKCELNIANHHRNFTVFSAGIVGGMDLFGPPNLFRTSDIVIQS